MSENFKNGGNMKITNANIQSEVNGRDFSKIGKFLSAVAVSVFYTMHAIFTNILGGLPMLA